MGIYGVFDILGPVMIGPSSSHTAGAARLGKIAKSICNNKLKRVNFKLHGSFAKTYKGHGTDKALVAGVLDMEPCDVRLKNSMKIAKEENIEIKFEEIDLGNVHPNTVKFEIIDINNKKTEVVGSSIGGGNVIITEVNKKKVEFSGEYPTLIISHKDVPGVVSKVTAIVYEYNINIAFMKVFRTEKGKVAEMVFETDTSLNEDIINKIKKVPLVEKVINIEPVKLYIEDIC
ncbi:L-serine ammonia-lyase, iron-sulfur-dependent subunit beta [Clostridium tarantellae]|uniref:L-serine deaminase n=1 Tax=Clostridium tarantellae TaxID=39493 RepID=A0A6I1MSV0_9CLOT|nr:L-serine ammonia-lyase, iron-sulfur-dependent subunit beta [Clostridium tarantellae]MPQ43309.1 L-serine ammonia-lyase, iron-sulfur-dependent, subunit beta [Clostridium tarantellae]